MLWPATNCSPIMRMAMFTPLRIKGSPPLPISRVKALDKDCSLFTLTNLPVSIRHQVAALTNKDGDSPICKRSEEHTSELQSLMRNSYAVFFLKQKKYTTYMSTTINIY